MRIFKKFNILKKKNQKNQDVDKTNDILDFSQIYIPGIKQV